MDQDEALRKIVERAREVLDALDKNVPLNEDGVQDLAESLLDLDEWLVKGGALPARWNRERGE